MIDLHGHVVPRGIPFLDRLAEADGRWLRFANPPEGPAADVMRGGALFRRVRSVAWDLAERRDALEAEGVSLQMISAMPDLMAPWAPAPDARAFGQAFNEWLAGAVADSRGFYRGLGLVPGQDPELACEALAEIDALGLDGALLPSQPVAGLLHDAPWQDFLAEAARRGLLLLVHAVAPPGRSAGLHPRAANGVVFPNAVGEAAAGLIASGAMARHPGLRLLLSHGGGSLPALLPRIAYLRQETPELQEIMPEEPVATARRMWFDPLVFDAATLQGLVDLVGGDRIVHGTDYPFMRAPLAYLDTTPIRGLTRAALDRTNPAALLAELDGRH